MDEKLGAEQNWGRSSNTYTIVSPGPQSGAADNGVGCFAEMGRLTRLRHYSPSTERSYLGAQALSSLQRRAKPYRSYLASSRIAPESAGVQRWDDDGDVGVLLGVYEIGGSSK